MRRGRLLLGGLGFATAFAVSGCARPTANATVVELAVTERRGPTGHRIALVTDVNESVSDTAWVYVHDPEQNNAKPFVIGDGYGVDSSSALQDVVWSKDGSVVAIRTIADDPDTRKAGAAVYAVAYDFRQHGYPIDPTLGNRPSREIQEAYSNLFKERGGKGLVQLTRPYELIGDAMTPELSKIYGDPRR